MSEPKEVPRNVVKLIPAGKGGAKKRQAIIKFTSGAELTITRQRADGQTVGVRGYLAGFKTLNTEDLLTALMYVTNTDEELKEMRERS